MELRRSSRDDPVAQKLQLEKLVHSRLAAFKYMSSVHKGETLWMNCVDLEHAIGIATIYDEWLGHEKQVEKWFTLGTSLGHLIDRKSYGSEFVRQTLQLLFELDFYYSSSTKQSLKLLIAKDLGNFPEMQPQATQEPVDASRVVLYKSGGRPIYTYLRLPHASNTISEMNTSQQDNTEPSRTSVINTSGRQVSRSALDELEVVLSLCGMLTQLYMKFLDPQFVSHLDTIIRIDNDIQQLVLEPYTLEFNKHAIAIIRSELKKTVQ